MKDGTASHTARSVVARRLEYERAAVRPAHEPPASLPLSALLSQALVAFTIEADNETEHRLPHRTRNLGLAPDAPPGAPWLTSPAASAPRTARAPPTRLSSEPRLPSPRQRGVGETRAGVKD